MRCKYFLPWVETSRGEINDDVQANNAPFDQERLKGEECYVGLDLASKGDISASCLFFPKYKVGEVVAVAQSYKDAGILYDEHTDEKLEGCAGWTNKMFVASHNIPHRIRITNVRVERLQDISDEDVYKEGFTKEAVNNGWGNYAYHYEAMLVYYDKLGRSKEIRSRNPREAFAGLIDKVSGKGIWNRNPWVFVYEFVLVK